MKKVESLCIIDDDPIFVYGIKRILKEENFCDTITVYENGQEAIEELSKIITLGKELPSIIFLDLNMPIMNGWDFLEDFVKIPSQNRKKVTIYIISSSVDPRDINRIKDFDVVNNYILKPISLSDLKRVAETI